MRPPLFRIFELETSSYCNRLCSSCIRNSHPDRQAVSSWFEEKFLPFEAITDLLEQVDKMGFTGQVCLQHYNEPVLDPRIAEIGRYARARKKFKEVFICTNADVIDDERAKELDGAFDFMLVALYMKEPEKQERAEYMKSRFRKTRLSFTGGGHIPTHFSPDFPVSKLAEAHKDRPCSLPRERLIINHLGECLMCCEDLLGNFGLGNIRDHSLEELWYGEKHQQMIKDLDREGGRMNFSYCVGCPRP